MTEEKPNFNTEGGDEGDYTPGHGPFKANISAAEFVPDKKTGSINKVSSNGVEFITIKLTIDYVVGEEGKSRNVWISPGFWFPDTIKTLMQSLGMDDKDPKDRAKMGDLKTLIGKDVAIFIGGREFDGKQTNQDGSPRHVENFEGYGVIEFDGERNNKPVKIRAIDTDILFFMPYQKGNSPEYVRKNEEFIEVKKRFKDREDRGGVDAPPTDDNFGAGVDQTTVAGDNPDQPTDGVARGNF